jgi:hypothetical protein
VFRVPSVKKKLKITVLEPEHEDVMNIVRKGKFPSWIPPVNFYQSSFIMNTIYCKL